jgi:hypothetical protein
MIQDKIRQRRPGCPTSLHCHLPSIRQGLESVDGHKPERLWQHQSKRHEARALLASIDDRVAEGFDTADPQATKALLEELA